ncbi:helix-turn-helix domain-containing protein [Eilatimonas milleporae]|uniref:Homeodomain-like domain-containing protein n=1 Tax=Eilatimonas milleporae TaxID=911205 RepID=A0A3M0CRN6_9PROT|nr:helix-turn-helix domain-containing protein [Eilatimonas milleporae]RMB12142.1 Homeodomain-like domain-containing protein [Eilatimonas milleporae]
MRERISVNVSIPLELAEALIEHGPDLIDGLKASVEEVYKRQAEDARRLAWQEERLAQHWRNCIQAYRMYRRLQPSMGAAGAYPVIAAKFGWPSGVVSAFVRQRRKKVNDYLKSRRLASVHRMVLEGRTDSEIAGHLGVSLRTVARFLKEIRGDSSLIRQIYKNTEGVQ